MGKLKIVSKAGIIAVAAAPLALSAPVAYATDECVTADEHKPATATAAGFTPKPLASPASLTRAARPVLGSPMTVPNPVGTPEVTIQLASAPTGASSTLLWAGVAVGALVTLGAVGGGVAYARKQ
ncbi:hypothetical protein [Saccharopolyspora tripterygii]